MAVEDIRGFIGLPLNVGATKPRSEEAREIRRRCTNGERAWDIHRMSKGCTPEEFFKNLLILSEIYVDEDGRAYSYKCEDALIIRNFILVNIDYIKTFIKREEKARKESL